MTRKLLIGLAFAAIAALALPAAIKMSCGSALADDGDAGNCEPARWSGKLAMGPGMGMMHRRGMGPGGMRGGGMMRGNVVRHR